MEYILYSIGILFLYVFCGFGLTFLICPKNLERYTLFIAPFVGLTYFSCLGMYFANFSALGSNIYATWLLFPPVISLGVALYLKKERMRELTWPFQKDNLLLICVCIVIFLGISAPFLFKLNTLTTMTLGNNDIAHYAAVSKFLTQSSFVQPPINVDSDFVGRAQYGAHFAAYFSTAIPSSIFSIDLYKIQNLVSNLFYVFTLPIVFLMGIEIFRFKKFMAVIITLLTGLSFHLIYINYNGFLGQVLGLGMFLSLILVTVFALINCDKFSSYLPYIPLTTVLTLGLILAYSPLLLLYYIPVCLFLLMIFFFERSGSYLLNSLGFILVTLIGSFIIAPFAVIQILKDIGLFSSISAGWGMPVIFPDMAFGLVGNNIGMQPNPIVDGILSLPIILIVLISLVYLFKTERRLFYLSISYISFVVLLCAYLTFQEISSPSFTGESYKAYKVFTYFIPIIFLSGLSYFRNFDERPQKKHSKLKKRSLSQIIMIVFLILLVLGNILSASTIITANYDRAMTIDPDIIYLEKITKMDNVTSINIYAPPWWDHMWVYYFLFMDKKLNLQYSSYYPVSPPEGEWTLQQTKPYDIVIVETSEPMIIKINKGYYLTKNNLEPVLSKGWYGLESKNDNEKWRWTGANNEDPTIKLYVQNEGNYVDFLLNYSAAEGDNNFTVFLDGEEIAECNVTIPNRQNFCSFRDIAFTKGEHEMVFKSKLPARVFGTGDPRSFGYAFSGIKIIVKNADVKQNISIQN